MYIYVIIDDANKNKGELHMPKRLSEKCSKCPFVKTCTKKKMEAVSYLEPAAQPNIQSLAEPLMVKHDYRDVKIDSNTTVTIDLEEIKKKMREEVFNPFILNYGG